MNGLAKGLDHALNGTPLPGIVGVRQPRNGFILMVFPFEGHEGRCNYISNAQRADIVTLLKEQLARFEGQAEQAGHA
jgi:hypothetical protein